MGKFLWLIALGTIVLMLQPAVQAQEEDWEEILDIVNGKVTSIDMAGNTLTITDVEGGTQTFTLDPNLTTVWDDTADEEKELGDLEAGKEVVVEFRVDEDGNKIASWIDIIAVEAEEPEVEVEEVEIEAPVEE